MYEVQPPGRDWLWIRAIAIGLIVLGLGAALLLLALDARKLNAYSAGPLPSRDRAANGAAVR